MSWKINSLLLGQSYEILYSNKCIIVGSGTCFSIFQRAHLENVYIIIGEKSYFSDTNTTKVSLLFIPIFCLNKAGCRNAYKFQLMARLVNLSLFFQTGQYICADGMFCKIHKARSKAVELVPVWIILSIFLDLDFNN